VRFKAPIWPLWNEINVTFGCAFNDTRIKNAHFCDVFSEPGFDCVKSFWTLDHLRCNIDNIYVRRSVVTVVTVHYY
jgi:hypothetical protein